MPEQYTYDFTIFVPTFNRGYLLDRVFESIERQTFRNAEVLVIDDGSTDNTDEVVQQWSQKTKLAVRYFRKPNGGKISAHNFALDKIRGYFTVILDSDDVLTPDALEIFKEEWESIPCHEREQFAGIEGYCLLTSGAVQGSTFPEDRLDANYLEIQYRYRVRGDKKNAIRSELLRQYPYPEFPGERNMPPSVVWVRLAQKYKFRCVNRPVQVVEQLPDGLTARRFLRQMQSPRGFRLAAQELLEKDFSYFSRRDIFRFSVRYVRFSLHAGISLMHQFADAPRKLFWALAFPEGMWRWGRDKCRFWYAKRKESKYFP